MDPSKILDLANSIMLNAFAENHIEDTPLARGMYLSGMIDGLINDVAGLNPAIHLSAVDTLIDELEKQVILARQDHGGIYN